MSILFSIGELVPKNDKKAFVLMQMAAKQGVAQSQNSLAMMYFKGIGVSQSYRFAYFWASASAKQGDKGGERILLFLAPHR